MIKRHYFLSMRRHFDNSTSFSFASMTLTRNSWLAQPHEAYRQAVRDLKEESGWEEHDKVEVVCFCRI